MFRIKLLGGVSLERDGSRVEGIGPRRAALLAALALAGPRGVSRDRLLLFLWPESTEEKARHSLAQLVYSVHRLLGAEVVESEGLELRLDQALVTSDVGDFLSAHARGDVEAMAGLYAGPLLDGFILSNAAEFDGWASAERTRFERLALEGLERAARLADEAGDPSADRPWRRLTDLAPLVTRYAIGLARALARSTDPGTALGHLREHARRLKTEVNVPAPPELEQMMAELTRQPPRSSPMPSVIAESASVPSQSGEAPREPAIDAAPAGRSRRPIRLLAAIGIGSIIIAALAWYTRRPVRTLSGGAMVVLADVENLTPDSTLGPALRVAVDVGLGQSAAFSLYPRGRLRASLARMGRTIADTLLGEPLAREVALREAGQAVVVVTVAAIGGRYPVSSRIIDPASGRILAAHRVIAQRADALVDAVDRITTWTRRQLGDTEWGTAPRLPVVTTSSLDALRAFADGGAALARFDWAVARRFLTRAIELDSGFAMARALLGEWHLANNNIPEALASLREAERRADRLSEPEQLNLYAMLARAEGRTDAFIASTKAIATKYPSSDAWRFYGEALRSARRYEEAIAAFERALAIDSTDVDAAHRLALAHDGAGNYRDALDAYARVDRLDSTFLLNIFLNHQWGRTFVAIGDLAGAEATFKRMLARPAPADRARGHRSLAYLALYRGRFADAVAELQAGIPLQNAGSLSEYRDLVVLADAERTRGDNSASDATLERMVAIFRKVPIEAAAVMFGGHQLVRARQLDRASLFLDSLSARSALRPHSEQDQAALAILRADLALAQGRLKDARRALDRPHFAPYDALGYSLRAELFASAGQHDSAVAMAKAATENQSFGLETQMDWLLSFALLARTAEAAGDSATARGAWSALIQQWDGGDPDLPPLVAARRALARLQAELRR